VKNTYQLPNTQKQVFLVLGIVIVFGVLGIVIVFGVLRIVMVLASAVDHVINLMVALALKIEELVGTKAGATITPDLRRDLSLTLVNCTVAAIPLPSLVSHARHHLAVTIGNDTGCFITQVFTLFRTVTEALLLFFGEHLFHTSSGTFIEGSSAPVTAAAIPAPVTNFTIDGVWKIPPGSGTATSHTTPEVLCYSSALTQTIIESKIIVVVRTGSGTAGGTAAIININTATITAFCASTSPFAITTTARVKSNTITIVVAIVAAAKGDVHVVVDKLVL